MNKVVMKQEVLAPRGPSLFAKGQINHHAKSWHKNEIAWHENVVTHPVHDHINQQHLNIQFTIEEEKEGKVAFLDVQITRNPNGLSTSVYRKPTHTDRYILFHSHRSSPKNNQPLEY